jgi:hypothetical protein
VGVIGAQSAALLFFNYSTWCFEWGWFLPITKHKNLHHVEGG